MDCAPPKLSPPVSPAGSKIVSLLLDFGPDPPLLVALNYMSAGGLIWARDYLSNLHLVVNFVLCPYPSLVLIGPASAQVNY